MVSVTTLDDELKRKLEPRTAGPRQRLNVIRELASNGVPTGVMAAPIIPTLNDHELERILEQAAAAGARSAGYVLLRLPHELKDLFEEWLREHYPDRAGHVLSLIRQMHGGSLYDSTFHGRQRGAGPFAALLRARFERARRTLRSRPRNRPELHGVQASSAPGRSARPLDALASETSKSQYSSVSIFVRFTHCPFGFQ